MDIEDLIDKKYKKDKAMNILRLIHFLYQRSEKNPNKTNIKRLEMIRDVLSGMSSADFSKKHKIKTSDPSRYLSKIINRFANYANLDCNIGIRDIRKYAKGL